jgi:hypothetical protein
MLANEHESPRPGTLRRGEAKRVLLSMPHVCPHCYLPLVPIQVFPGQTGPGLPYADGAVNRGLFGGFVQQGVIHGARCPRCQQVFFFAFPLEAGEYATAADAFKRLGRTSTPAVEPAPQFDLSQLDSLEDLVALGVSGEWTTRLRVIERLEELATPGAAAAVARILERALEDDLPTVARVAIDSATRLGPPPQLEPLLLRCLRSAHDQLVVTALAALGEVGAITTVPAIRESARGLFRPGSIKTAASQAVERLTARHRPAPDGALSVTQDARQRGALSRLNAEAGLSLEEPGDEERS